MEGRIEAQDLIGQLNNTYAVVPEGIVIDENYVHTDNNYTNEEKEKLAILKNYDDTEIKENIEKNTNDILEVTNEISTIENEITDITTNINEIAQNVDKNSQNITKNTQEINNINEALEGIDNELLLKANKTELPDVSEFIKKTVDDLVNYYKKDETYTQQEVNQLVGSIKTVSMKIVPEKPSIGETNVIYLIPNSKSEIENIYDEYIYANDKWELIGSTAIDLSDIYTKNEINTILYDYITSNDLEEILKDYATLSSIPTKTSDLENDNIKGGIIVEIGEYQYSYESTILPALPVEIAKQIYDNDKNGIPQTLHWTLYGSENNLKVVSSDHIMGNYSIDVLIHNKYHCAYEWNKDTTGEINPNVQTQQEVPVFTNTSLGTIKGSTDNGKINANSDGTGTVNGFQELQNQMTIISASYASKKYVDDAIDDKITNAIGGEY